MTREIPARVAERAATKFVAGPNGCHLSTYSIGSHGYAQIGWWDRDAGRARMTTAHRAAWVFYQGPIPDQLTVDHMCHTPRCVNPDHLRLLTNSANAADNRRVRTNPDAGRRHHCGAEMARSLTTGEHYCRDCINRSGKERRAAARVGAGR